MATAAREININIIQGKIDNKVFNAMYLLIKKDIKTLGLALR